MTVDIVVKNVDVAMLREQRDDLIAAIKDVEGISTVESLDGIVNLLDAMLDNAEGY